jgi:hypothetical protein
MTSLATSVRPGGFRIQARADQTIYGVPGNSPPSSRMFWPVM